MNNVHNRLQNVRTSLLDCLRTVEPANRYVRLGEPMRLPPDATQEQIQTCRLVAAMDATVPDSDCLG